MDYVLRPSFSGSTGDCVYVRYSRRKRETRGCCRRKNLQRPNVLYQASSTCWEGDASRTLRSSALQVIYNITEEESPHPSAYKGHTTRSFARPTWQSTKPLASCAPYLEDSNGQSLETQTRLDRKLRETEILAATNATCKIVVSPASFTAADIRGY